MKKLLLLLGLLTLLMSNQLLAQNEFITTWQTTDGTITIPTNDESGTLTYNYDVSWTNLDTQGLGDGSASGETGDLLISGLSNGETYQIAISGDFPRIYFNNGSESDKILTIEQWGDIQWTSMENAFFGCTNLTYNATDAPDLSVVTNLTSMFRLAQVFNGDLSNWDVSNITTMNSLFFGARDFNGDISTWDVSAVNSMNQMFGVANTFNVNISGWNTSNLTSAVRMFRLASSFNQPIGSWDMSTAEDISYMFEGAPVFNQDLNSWNLASVLRMEGLFRQASAFNSDISAWSFPNVTDLSELFVDASSFDQNLADWDISSVTDMTDMLSGTNLNTTNYDATLQSWASQAVQNGVTLGATGLTYCDAETARSTLTDSPNNWIINDAGKNCKPFITTWQTTDGTITIPTNDESGTLNYNYDVSWTNLDTQGLGNGSATGETGDVTITGLANGNTYQIEITGDFPRIYFNGAGDKDKLLSIEQWGDIQWASMKEAFRECTNLVSNAEDAPDLGSVTDMSEMFYGCDAFTGDLSNWDVSNVNNMSFLFSFTDNFNSDLSSWDVSAVTDMRYMFGISLKFNQDISNWNTSNVTDMSNMFQSCLDFNKSLNGWDVSNVTSMIAMFRDATSFNQSLENWNISNVGDMSSILNNSGLSTTKYDATLQGWAAQTVQTGLTLGATGLTYCETGYAAHQTLSVTYGWTFDGDQACAVNIPDANFKNALLANVSINTVADGEIRLDEAREFVGAVSVVDLAIEDLTGIEEFHKATALFCQKNNLTALNIQTLPQLVNLQAWQNNIASIDLSNNVNLISLNISSNNLSAIDLSNNIKLRTVIIGGSNSITQLDVSMLPDLDYLGTNDLGTLTSIDVSNNSLLTRLQVDSNDLSALDVSNNTNLTQLHARSNNLSLIDLSSNTLLEDIRISFNSLTYVGLKNSNNSVITVFEATSNPDLSCIEVDDVTYFESNFSGNIDAGASYSTFCNVAPSDITLSSNSIAENNAVGDVIGAFSTTDINDTDTHTYSLVAGSGDNDNSSFNINGEDLEAAEVFDFETKSSFSIRVATTDAGGLTFEEVFTITLIDVNDSPTAISLSASSIAENNSIGDIIGSFSTTDENTEDTHIYTLIAGTGGTDNASFTISGSELQAAEVFDFETKNSYSIRVETNDGNGGTFESAFTISITDVEEKQEQTITIEPIEAVFATAADFEVTATTSSGLALSYAVLSGPATIAGSTVSLTGETGTVEIEVNQAGSENFLAATATTSFSVLADPCADFAATAAVLQNVSCNGGANGSFSVNPTAGTGPFTYIMGETSQEIGTFENLEAGTYEVSITDANGCSATASVEITAPEALTATAETTDSNSIFGNGSISLTATGGTGAYTYSWSNGATSATLSDLGTGEYTVTITDEAGCSLTESYTIGGVTSNPEDFEMRMYPNPVVNQLQIRHGEGVEQISLLDATGKIIQQEQATNSQSTVDMKSLPAGLYFIRLDDGKMERIIKQ